MTSLTKGFRKRKAEPEMRRRMRWQEHIAKLRQAGYEPCPPKLAVIINEDYREGQDMTQREDELEGLLDSLHDVAQTGDDLLNDVADVIEAYLVHGDVDLSFWVRKIREHTGNLPEGGQDNGNIR